MSNNNIELRRAEREKSRDQWEDSQVNGDSDGGPSGSKTNERTGNRESNLPFCVSNNTNVKLPMKLITRLYPNARRDETKIRGDSK